MDHVLFCGYASLFHFLICSILAVVVIVRTPARLLSQIYAGWALSVGVWFVSYFITFAAKKDFDILFWFRLSLAFASWIPALSLHYFSVQLKEEKRKRWLVYLVYFLSAISCGLSFTTLSIVGIESRNGYPTLPIAGVGYHFFVVLYGASFICVLFQILQKILKEGDRRSYKRQLWMSLTLFFVAGIGACASICLTYGLPMYLALIFLLTAYMFFMAAATFNHRLWYSDYAISQGVVVLFLGGIFALSYFGTKTLLDFFIGETRSFHALIAAGVAFFLGYFIYRPIGERFFDRTIFQKKYDYQKLLKDASRGMSKIKSLDRLLKLVVHFITMKVRVCNVAILMRNRDEEKFDLKYQRGYEKCFVEYSVQNSNALIQYLTQEKEAIDMDKIGEYIAAGNQKKVLGERPHKYDFEAMRQNMIELQAECCVPSFLGRELKNILVLGEKKAGDFYTEADLTILYTLAQESAIAIENAGLYDEAVLKTGELAQINEQLEYSKSLLMKALNETEVANKQLQDTQAQLIHEQKMATLGRLAASVGHEVNNPLTILSMNVSRAILKYRKNPDLRVGEILELFQKMEQNIGRIKAVVNTLTGLLKKSEKGKFEPLSLKLILEETLPLVQFQTYLDNLTGTEVEFDIPGNIPLVRGDLERLQEVFLNLFINAYHAMQGKRNRRIQVKAELDQSNGKMVAIYFMDNGSGMTEETRKKIFNYGYTTKGPGRGSGLGLYMCKYIIELHGGDIRVESTIDVGTTFILTLPIYTEGSTDSNDLKVGGAVS